MGDIAGALLTIISDIHSDNKHDKKGTGLHGNKSVRMLARQVCSMFWKGCNSFEITLTEIDSLYIFSQWDARFANYSTTKTYSLIRIAGIWIIG